MTLQPALEIRQELWQQIRKTRPGNARSPVGYRRARSSARRRVIRIGKTGAHRRAKHIRPVESRPARIVPGGHRPADSVSNTRPQLAGFAHAPIARVLAKRGGEHEIAPKILANDIPDRSSEALGVSGRPGMPTIERRGAGDLRYRCVESARAEREGGYGFVGKVFPLFGGRRRSQDDARIGGALRGRCQRDEDDQNRSPRNGFCA